jgi:hypothetical protein
VKALYRPGEGATFPGGPGGLGLKLTRIGRADDGSWLLEAGKLRYFLNAKDGAISGAVGDGGKVAFLRPSLPLTRLGLKRQTATDVVLASDFLTLGFHADGLLVFVPHRMMALRLHSLVSSDAKPEPDAGRLELGGSFGGICLHPDAPLTPTRPPSFEVLTPKKPDARHWEARWRVVPGQRLGVGLIEPVNPEVSPRNPEPLVLTSEAPDLVEQVGAARAEGRKALVRIALADIPEIPAFLRTVRFSRLGARADGVILDGLDALPWPDAYSRVRLARETFPQGGVYLPPRSDEESFPLPSFIRAYTDGQLGGD